MDVLLCLEILKSRFTNDSCYAVRFAATDSSLMEGKVERLAVFFSAKEVGKSDWLLDLSYVNCVLLVFELSVMDSREEKFGPEERD